MSYAIDERNFERQQLLAEMLNPLTRQVLDRIPGGSIANILDLGCGQGHTTRLLAEYFPKASSIGFEYDAVLVTRATDDPSNAVGIAFQQGDAAQLPFPDASFDLVFTRYMLLHVPDREMFRVTRPGGFVVAYEPDCCIEFCYPPNAAMERMSYLWCHLFPHPLMGRQLLHLFRSAGATKYSAGALLGMDHDQGFYKRWYGLTAEAVGPNAISKELMTLEEFDALLASARQLEADPQSVCFKLPDVWVIASV
ncbi:MAG: methyltransferase domain-containing protein [Bryobacteraceae bacterium]